MKVFMLETLSGTSRRLVYAQNLCDALDTPWLEEERNNTRRVYEATEADIRKFRREYGTNTSHSNQSVR